MFVCPLPCIISIPNLKTTKLQVIGGPTCWKSITCKPNLKVILLKKMTFTELVNKAHKEFLDSKEKFVVDFEEMVFRETNRIALRKAEIFGQGEDRQLDFKLIFIKTLGDRVSITCNCSILCPDNLQLRTFIINFMDREIGKLLEICDRVVNKNFDDVVVNCVEVDRSSSGSVNVKYNVYSPLFPKPDLQPRSAISYLKNEKTEIDKQREEVRRLKAEKANPEDIRSAIDKLKTML